MAAFPQAPRPMQSPDGQFLPYITLDFINNRGEALALLRPLAATVAVPGQGIAAELQRTVLRALIEHGLIEQDGSWGLKSVAKQQVGEAMLKLMPTIRPDVAAAYRTEGLSLTELLNTLHTAGLLSMGHIPGNRALHYSARLHWLQPYGRRGAAPPASTQHQPRRLVPLPTLPTRHTAPPLPVPLQQLPTAAPMAAGPAAAAPAAPAAPVPAGAAGQVTVRTVTSEAAAGAAVASLLAAPGGRFGMACEASGPGRDPSALTISLFAPSIATTGVSTSGGGSGGSGGTCYVFELGAMPPQDRRAAVRLLAAVLENQQFTKVLHDCRSAAQALFNLPGRSIELRGICDTQVAHGLAQFLSLLGTEEAADGVDEPVPLQRLLHLHQVPHPNLGTGMTSQTASAAAAAAPLLALSTALEASLGPLAAARLPALSRAFSRWDLDLAAYTAVPRPSRQWLAHLLDLAPLCM